MFVHQIVDGKMYPFLTLFGYIKKSPTKKAQRKITSQLDRIDRGMS